MQAPSRRGTHLSELLYLQEDVLVKVEEALPDLALLVAREAAARGDDLRRVAERDENSGQK